MKLSSHDEHHMQTSLTFFVWLGVLSAKLRSFELTCILQNKPLKDI